MKVKTLAAKLVGVVVAVFLAVFLTQCGGGGGGTTGDNTQPQTLSGTVAVGKPLANTPVYLKDKNGQVSLHLLTPTVDFPLTQPV